MKANFDVVLDCSDPLSLSKFWQEALGYKVQICLEEICVLVPPTEVRPPLILQRVPESKNGKNRMHIDIVIDDVEGEVSRLETLGARRLHSGVRSMGSSRWITMADPEGNEFCVCTGVEW